MNFIIVMAFVFKVNALEMSYDVNGIYHETFETIEDCAVKAIDLFHAIEEELRGQGKLTLNRLACEDLTDSRWSIEYDG